MWIFTLGTTIQLLYVFIVCVCSTFIIAVPFSPKYITSIWYIYGLFADESKQQGSDTLEAVNCWSPWRSCCFTCSDLQIKEVFFHFVSAVFFFCAGAHNMYTWPLGGRNTTQAAVKKTWTKYNLYSLYTLHTMQYYRAFYTFPVSTE